jgi:fluoride exporter
MPPSEALTLTMSQKLAWLALAGALGTLARFGLSGAVQKWSGATFPWGTFLVNALGCLLFGFVWQLAEGRRLISPDARLIGLTGFLGAFTTFSTFAFSTFAFESTQMIREGQWLPLAGNLIGQNALGIVCVVLGMALGRML